MSDTGLTAQGVLVWFICAFFFMYEFLLRTVLGTFQFPIMADLHLSAVQFAIMSSTVYQIVYGLMQLPVGVIAEKIGLKKTLLLAAVICTVANLGFSLTQQFELALFFRILMGLGSSFGFICLLLAVYNWLPGKRFAFFVGVSQFIGTMGPMLAAGPLNALSEHHILGWRGLFLSLAVVGGFIAILIFCFVSQNNKTANNFLVLSRPSSLFTNLRLLMRQKQVWLIGIFSSSVYFSLEYLSENEGTAFLISKGFSSVFSSYLITIAWLGYAIGCPFIGYYSDKLKHRKKIMCFSACLVLISLISLIYLPLNKLLILIGFFLLGCGASGQSIGFAIIKEYCLESYLTVGLAFNNTMIMIFGAINAPLLGFMLDYSSDSSSYTLVDYQVNFIVMVAFVLVGVLISGVFIKETFCKQVHENTVLNPTSSFH